MNAFSLVAPPSEGGFRSTSQSSEHSIQKEKRARSGDASVEVVNGRIVPSLVVLSGDTITSVTPNGAPPANAQVVDGLGKFLIPGLWDMHAHVEATRESSLQL